MFYFKNLFSMTNNEQKKTCLKLTKNIYKKKVKTNIFPSKKKSLNFHERIFYIKHYRMKIKSLNLNLFFFIFIFYSYMLFDASCKEVQIIQKLLWEIIFDLHNHYYIDLFEQILTSVQNRMEKYVQQCIRMCITKVLICCCIFFYFIFIFKTNENLYKENIIASDFSFQFSFFVFKKK